MRAGNDQTGINKKNLQAIIKRERKAQKNSPSLCGYLLAVAVVVVVVVSYVVVENGHWDGDVVMPMQKGGLVSIARFLPSVASTICDPPATDLFLFGSCPTREVAVAAGGSLFSLSLLALNPHHQKKTLERYREVLSLQCWPSCKARRGTCPAVSVQCACSSGVHPIQSQRSNNNKQTALAEDSIDRLSFRSKLHPCQYPACNYWFILLALHSTIV